MAHEILDTLTNKLKAIAYEKSKRILVIFECVFCQHGAWKNISM